MSDHVQEMSDVDLLVGTGELLQHLQRHSEQDAVHHTWSSKCLVPRVIASAGCFSDFLNLFCLVLNECVMFGDTVELGHCGTSSRRFASVPIEPGRLRQK